MLVPQPLLLDNHTAIVLVMGLFEKILTILTHSITARVSFMQIKFFQSFVSRQYSKIMLSLGPKGYEKVDQIDQGSDDDINDTDEINTNTLNTLRNLFTNSPCIQGYLSSISNDINPTPNKSKIDYNPIYTLICDFYGIKSIYNAVQIQDNQIVKYLYTQSDAEIINEPTPEQSLLLAINSGNIQIVETIINSDTELINKYTQNRYKNEQNPYIPSNIFINAKQSENPLISLCIYKLFEYSNLFENDEEQTSKYMKITKILLSAGISPNGLSDQQASLLHYACLKRDFEFIKLLVNDYKINLDLASKRDDNNFMAMDYLTEDEDENEIREYLEKEIQAHDNNNNNLSLQKQDRFHDSGAFCIWFGVLNILCFLPWTLVGVINACILLIDFNEINWSLSMIGIIIIMLGVGLLGIVGYIARKTVYKTPAWAALMLISIIMLQQIFYVIVLMVQLSLNEYNITTLTLSIISVCLVMCLDCGLCLMLYKVW